MTETEKREILDAIAVIEAQIYYKRDIFDKALYGNNIAF